MFSKLLRSILKCLVFKDPPLSVLHSAYQVLPKHFCIKTDNMIPKSSLKLFLYLVIFGTVFSDKKCLVQTLNAYLST